MRTFDGSRKTLAILGLLVLIAYAGALIWRRPAPPRGFTVTFLDVGEGNCVFVESPAGTTVLIDGGGSNDQRVVDKTNVGLRDVVPYLHSLGINHLDLVILTQPQGNHCGGLTAVLREETVGAVLDGALMPYPSADYALFRQEIAASHIPYARATAGMRFSLGDGARATVLNPPLVGIDQDDSSPNGAIDNNSVILRLSYGKTHFLLTSDAEGTAEQSLLASKAALSADVLQCGHSGSAQATSGAWLAAVHPRFAIICCSAHNPFGYPSAAVLSRLKAARVTTFCTATNGAVSFESNGVSIFPHPFVSN